MRVANSVGCYGPAVAEHSFALLLSLMKKLYRYEDDQRAHVWGEEGNVSTLDGASVLVMGAGDIGEHFARLCTAMGATCTAYRSHVPAELSDSYRAAFAHTIAGRDALMEALPSSQVVASFLPSTSETKGLVDEEYLGVHGQSAHDGYALFLTAGELGGVGRSLVGQTDTLEQLQGGFAGFIG